MIISLQQAIATALGLDPDAETLLPQEQGGHGHRLAAWDAQVRFQIESNQRLTSSVDLGQEHAVLEELATRTALYGPWRAAAALFGAPGTTT